MGDKRLTEPLLLVLDRLYGEWTHGNDGTPFEPALLLAFETLYENQRGHPHGYRTQNRDCKACQAQEALNILRKVANA